MKIGIIGLGDIALKAYLPVITRSDIELVLCSRSETVVINTANEYRIKEYCYDYRELINYSVDAVFIHTATSSHYQIVKFFLENKVHVYVDKPISDRLEETMELYEIALKNNTVLMVGFNRRYSPRVSALMKLKKPDMLMIQKNRYNHPSGIRTFIYDDFIHVIDTLLFLYQGQEKEFDYNSKIVEGKLNNLVLILQGEGSTAFGSMNRMSGVKEERIEYMVDNVKQIIHDLDHCEIYENNSKKTIDYDDWTPILKRRGFEDIITQFLEWVEKPENSVDDLEMSLRTHEVCEYLVMELTESIKK